MTAAHASPATDILDAARCYANAGMSVIPVNGKKKPTVEWAAYQDAAPDDQRLAAWFGSNRQGIALVNGKVSGNRETLDFDDPAAFHAWYERIPTEIGKRLAVVQSPSGGYHAHYACEEIAGNTKLAMNAPDDVAIETRGEGGYVILPPSVGYVLLAGDLCRVPLITPDERATLHDAARALDRCPQERRPDPTPTRAATASDERPGDRFNRENGQAEVVAMLERNGWQRKGSDGRSNALVLRPGDTDAESSGNVSPKGVLHIFSTNAHPFDTERDYDPFGVLAALEHGGSHSAAGTALHALYYPPARRVQKPPGKVVSISGLTVDDETGEIFEREYTDVGNADRLIDRHGADLRHSTALGWLEYDGVRWREGQGGVTRRAIGTVRAMYVDAADRAHAADQKAAALHALRSQSAQKIDAMMRLAKYNASIEIADPRGLDAQPWLLNVQNGTLDLRSGTLREHARGDMLTKLAPVAYDPTARCPNWLAFLDKIMGGNAALVAYLQRAIGYSLTGNTDEHVMFIPYGTGSNGKSTMLLTVEGMLGLGDYAATVQPETLTIKQNGGEAHDIPTLRGARFISTTEAEEGKRLAESLVKRLTSGDTIKARQLYREPFEMRVEGKIWFATNHKPIIRGTDTGIWRRLRLIPFTVEIPESERLPQGEMLATFAAERAGILAWAARGCFAWRNGGLQAPTEVLEATNAYRGEMDVLAQWLDDVCVCKPGASEQSDTLFYAYRIWCEKRNEYVLPQKQWVARLEERGFAKKRKTSGVTWLGVGLAGGDAEPF